MRLPWQRIWQEFGNSWRWQLVVWHVAWNLLSRITEMHEKQCFCHGLCHPLAKEFTREKFKLQHEPLDDFFKSQWQRRSKSVWWLLYRWALAVCFSVGVWGSLVQQFNEGKWFIYLTDWGFFMCMYTSLFGAILVSIYYHNTEKIAIADWVVKLYWASHWSTLVTATVITFVYWIFIYPTDNASATDLYNLWAHGFNSILMVLDHMLVAFPTRILHFVYPLVLGLVYAVFTLIYYFAGGLDINGNRFIYEILDWSKPTWATLTVFGCMLLIFIFCFLLFGLYKLRFYIYRKRNNAVLTVNT